jgi:hypothetical protein
MCSEALKKSMKPLRISFVTTEILTAFSEISTPSLLVDMQVTCITNALEMRCKLRVSIEVTLRNDCSVRAGSLRAIYIWTIQLLSRTGNHYLYLAERRMNSSRLMLSVK